MRRTLAPLLLACAWGAAAEPQAPGETVTASLTAPHRDDGGFFNPWAQDPKSLWGLLRWQLFSSNPYDKSGTPEIPVVPNDGAYMAGVEHSATVTWVGHATFALIPTRSVPPGIPLEAVPADAFAVISHNHYDHLDAYTVDALPASVGWYVPLGLADWFRERGRHDVVELDWWETAERGRWKITCLPSQHWSRRLGQGTNETLWCSWLLDSGDYRYYFAGDTGYFPGFREYGRRYPDIDVAMLPIGAYEPRWFMQYQHMDPAEALTAFEDLGARFMLPMHWGTFDLTDEPLDEAPRVLARQIEARGVEAARVRTLAVGERWKVPDR
jgi:N-acyl-phosphatidylethanolamine-hydrolysing phospholipase D